MDIEEMKKYSKNKIEAENLMKQIRQKIKETIWEKQNLREGFTETFRPLISQFEKPVDPKAQNIFTQNQKMLQNQLALTEGLKANQKAITDGFSQFERLADMQELPGVGAIEDGEDDKDDIEDGEDDKDDNEDGKDDQSKAVSPKLASPKAKESPIAKFDVDIFDKNLNNKKSLDILDSYGHSHLPSFYYDKNINDITSLISNVKVDLEDTQKELSTNIEYKQEGVYTLVLPKAQNPRQKTLEGIDNYNTLSIYLTNLNYLYQVKQKQIGSGLFSSPQELIRRFELLNGSLVAGNNGVLPEFIQILHRFRDLGILSNKQLNTLLRKVI